MNKKPRSRLNKRISAVRKNIVVKKALLNKLEKIKKSRKQQNTMSNVKSSLKRKRNSNKRISKVVNSLMLPYISEVKKMNNRTNSRKYSQSRNNYQNNVMNKLNRGNSLRGNSHRGNSHRGNYQMMRTPKINSRVRNNMNMNDHICLYKNFHEENVEVPESYPGDLWVHNNLLAERDKPLELFDEDYLKEVYANHRRICYGN